MAVPEQFRSGKHRRSNWSKSPAAFRTLRPRRDAVARELGRSAGVGNAGSSGIRRHPQPLQARQRSPKAKQEQCPHIVLKRLTWKLWTDQVSEGLPVWSEGTHNKDANAELELQ